MANRRAAGNRDALGLSHADAGAGNKLVVDERFRDARRRSFENVDQLLARGVDGLRANKIGSNSVARDHNDGKSPPERGNEYIDKGGLMLAST